MKWFCGLFVLMISVSMVLSNLRSDLREFWSIIPRRRIAFLAARHYILDPEFGVALNYIRSQQFMQTFEQIRATSEFRRIVDYLMEFGENYDVPAVIDEIPNQLRHFEIPTQVPVKLMLERNLSSFLNEVLTTLPRSKIASLMSRKVKEGGDFAKLYKALKQKQFRQLVVNARESENLEISLMDMERHDINVDQIIDITFAVLAWGP